MVVASEWTAPPPLFAARRRSWATSSLAAVLIVLIGLAATAIAARSLAHRTGVFWTQEQVRFLAPTSTDFPNSLPNSGASLVMTAGAVALIVDPHQLPQTSAPLTTLVGRGIRDGWAVTLPNFGGQWVKWYAQPFLDVQVVGSSAEAVQAETDVLITEIQDSLARLQRAAGVATANLIQAKDLAQGSPQVHYTTGSRSRALAAALALGVTGTALLLVAVRRLPAMPRGPVLLIGEGAATLRRGFWVSVRGCAGAVRWSGAAVVRGCVATVRWAWSAVVALARGCMAALRWTGTAVAWAVRGALRGARLAARGVSRGVWTSMAFAARACWGVCLAVSRGVLTSAHVCLVIASEVVTLVRRASKRIRGIVGWSRRRH